MKRCLGHLQQTPGQRRRNIAPRRCNKKIYEGLREGDYCYYHIKDFLNEKTLIIQRYWKGYKSRRVVKLYNRLPPEIQDIICFKVRQDHKYKRYKKTVKSIILNRFTPELKKTFLNFHFVYAIMNVYNIQNIQKIKEFLLFLGLVAKYFIFFDIKELSFIIKFEKNFQAIYYELTQIPESHTYYKDTYGPLKTYFFKIWNCFYKKYYILFKKNYINKNTYVTLKE